MLIRRADLVDGVGACPFWPRNVSEWSLGMGCVRRFPNPQYARLCFSLSGCGEMCIQEGSETVEAYPLGERQMSVWMGGDEVLVLRALSKEWRVVVMTLDGPLCDALWRSQELNRGDCFELPASLPSTLNRFFEEISKSTPSLARLSSWCYELLTVDVWSMDSDLPELVVSSCEWIDQGLLRGLELSVEDCSHRLGVSRFALTRLFKKHLGFGPKQYIQRQRYRMAMERMLSTEDTLYQIALDCGYGDLAHFQKSFKAFAGVSPARWRRENR